MARYPNILCRVNAIKPEFVVRYVENFPKKPLPANEFYECVEKKMEGFYSRNYKQAPLQWGLYYEDGGFCYPRFDRNISIDEAKQYIDVWLHNLVIPNPYCNLSQIKEPINLIVLLCEYMISNPSVRYLHDIAYGACKERVKAIDILKNTINQTNLFKIKRGKFRYYKVTVKKNYIENISDCDNQESLLKLAKFFKEVYDSEDELTSIPDDVLGKSLTFDEIKNLPNVDKVLNFKPEYNQIVNFVDDFNIKYKSYKNMDSKEYFHLFDSVKTSFNQDAPLQQVFYGAPGTGKSFAVNEVTKQYPDTIRTTFHPDSDYSTFVGAYKPSTTTVDRYGLNGIDTVALKYPDGDHAGDPIPESKIEYKFVKQAFLKAYIKAWKNYVKAWKNFITSSGLMVHSLINGPKESWLLTSLEGDEIKYTKTEIFSIEEYRDLVQKYWAKEMHKAKPEIGTHDHYGATACFWYKGQTPTTLTAEACWEAVFTELKNNSVIIGTPSTQTYRVSLEDGNIVVRSEYTTKKDKIENTDKETGSVRSAISKIINEYNLKTFDEGWLRLKNEIEKAKSPKSDPQYLVIEEINRGNCAQIFGDLFQLLDRKNGFSSYPIEADEDIRKALLEENPEDGLSFGKDGLSLSQEQRDYINQHYYQGDDVATKIQKGQVLVLPPNLYIWATMNTSDQSLFPIDSAFKRRWDWMYVPIQYEKMFKIGNEEKQNRSYSFVIKIGGNEYSWIKFLKQVNKKIYDLTDSEDKQMGNYFVDLPNGLTTIDENTFKNKVMFYLWNDICKDERENNENFYKTKDGGFSFNQLFESKGQELLIGFLDTFEDILIDKETSDGTSGNLDAGAPSQTPQESANHDNP